MSLSSRGDHDNRDMSITKNTELIGLLEQPFSSLRVSDLPVCCVLNLLDLDRPSSHFLDFLYLKQKSSGLPQENVEGVWGGKENRV